MNEFVYVALGLSIVFNIILLYFSTRESSDSEVNPSILSQLKEIHMAIRDTVATLKSQIDSNNAILERLGPKGSDLKSQLAAAQAATQQAQADAAAANAAKDQLAAELAAAEESLNALIPSVQTNTTDAQQLDSVLSG